jgi:murein DD-endopeptidase MepM/ murein hydrolase activator NlpD
VKIFRNIPRQWGIPLLIFVFFLVPHPLQAATVLDGQAIQGGLIFGRTNPGNQVFLDDQAVMVSGDGQFVIGFDRDATGTQELRISQAGAGSQDAEIIQLDIQTRQYDIERVDGLPPRTVTPDPEAAERIKREAALVSAARKARDQRTDYAGGFAWPAAGRISGVYGSQRVLNGIPARPHYGLDIAAPNGDPVYAPADGIITLAYDDMYYSGGTLILDHGQGLSSTFLHLSEILVEQGSRVRRGELIARIGATGRASGPHLDWRMNWLNQRVDPQFLVPGAPPPPASSGQ